MVRQGHHEKKKHKFKFNTIDKNIGIPYQPVKYPDHLRPSYNSIINTYLQHTKKNYPKILTAQEVQDQLGDTGDTSHHMIKGVELQNVTPQTLTHSIFGNTNHDDASDVTWRYCAVDQIDDKFIHLDHTWFLYYVNENPSLKKIDYINTVNRIGLTSNFHEFPWPLYFFCGNYSYSAASDKYRFDWTKLDRVKQSLVYKYHLKQMNKVIGITTAETTEGDHHVVNGSAQYFSTKNSSASLNAVAFTYTEFTRNPPTYLTDELTISDYYPDYKTTNTKVPTDAPGMGAAALTYGPLDIAPPRNFFNWYNKLTYNMTTIPTVSDGLFLKQLELDTAYKLKHLINTTFYTNNYATDLPVYYIPYLQTDTYHLQDEYDLSQPFCADLQTIKQLVGTLNSDYFADNVISNLMLPPALIGLTRCQSCHMYTDGSANDVDNLHLVAILYIRKPAEVGRANAWYEEYQKLILMESSTNYATPDYSSHL